VSLAELCASPDILDLPRASSQSPAFFLNNDATMVANPNYQVVPAPATPFKSFADFYPFYLGEHRNPVNRSLHLFGTSCAIALGLRFAASAVPHICKALDQPHWANLTRGWSVPEKDVWKWALAPIVMGYGFSWVGHFFAEKNRPATFKYPVWSLRGDFTMLWQVLTFQRKAW